MIKQRTRVRSVSNVAASKTALIELPCGPRYHGVFLTYTDTTQTTVANVMALLGEIRVKVNGRVQRTASWAQLQAVYAEYGAGFAAALVGTKQVTIPIHFAEPWRKDARDQDALAWPTAGWTSLQIEVDLPASFSALQVYAVTDNLQPSGPAVGIVKWIRQSFAAAGLTVDISTLDRRDWLQQITLLEAGLSAGTIGRVTIKKDGVLLHDLDLADNKGLLTTYGMSPMATGGYSFVADHDDLLGSAVPMDGSRDILLSVEAVGATAFVGNINSILQRLGAPE